ncbi:MAG: hypothetical protein Q8K78_06730 [Planctomycetaceae bacterium]|nr:hypothetical protein [Planctomycetaceae bacterium]
MPKIKKPSDVELSERSENMNDDLASRFDALNTAFNETELHLRALRPIRSVWVNYNQTSDDYGDIVREHLGMIKLDEKWQLCHAVEEQDSDGVFSDIQPVVECPIEVRVGAVKAVRMLHQKIVQEKDHFKLVVEDAIKELTDICTEI